MLSTSISRLSRLFSSASPTRPGAVLPSGSSCQERSNKLQRHCWRRAQHGSNQIRAGFISELPVRVILIKATLRYRAGNQENTDKYSDDGKGIFFVFRLFINCSHQMQIKFPFQSQSELDFGLVNMIYIYDQTFYSFEGFPCIINFIIHW